MIYHWTSLSLFPPSSNRLIAEEKKTFFALKQDDHRSKSYSTLLHPLVELCPLAISLFLLIISRLRFYRESYHYEFF